MIKKILYPVDFTEGSEAAAPLVADLVKKYGAKLYIVHVIYDIARVTGWYVPHASTENFYQELEKGAKAQMDKVMVEELRGYQDVERGVVIGAPAEEIIRFAQNNGIDLIVMGTHGRKGLDKVFFGSTAEKVVRAAPCPVLTVRAKS
jgi:nucleotide-binding universal stress UspA family protein